MDVPEWIGLVMVLLLVIIVAMLVVVNLLVVMHIRHLRAEMFEFRSALISIIEAQTVTSIDIRRLTDRVNDCFQDTWRLWLPAASLGPTWHMYYSSVHNLVFYHDLTSDATSWNHPGRVVRQPVTAQTARRARERSDEDASPW